MTELISTTRDEAHRILERAGDLPDGELDLAETALALAALDRPRVSLGWYRQHLARLGEEVGVEAQPADGAAERAAALQTVLAGRYGYQGDTLTYEDLQNANLMRVIDRRRGLPVALGIIYVHAARSQGWRMVGLNFPGHFLVRLETGPERAILDPFHGGMMRHTADLRDLLKIVAGAEAELRPEHYAAVSDREILLRLQNNIKLRFLRSQQVERAGEVLDGMLLIAPNQPLLWREAGLINARLGKLGAAIDGLERFLALGADDRLMHEAAVLVQQLKSRLN